MFCAVYAAADHILYIYKKKKEKNTIYTIQIFLPFFVKNMEASPSLQSQENQLTLRLTVDSPVALIMMAVISKSLDADA